MEKTEARPIVRGIMAVKKSSPRIKSIYVPGFGTMSVLENDKCESHILYSKIVYNPKKQMYKCYCHGKLIEEYGSVVQIIYFEDES